MRALAIIALLLAACSGDSRELRDAGRLGRVELFRPRAAGPPELGTTLAVRVGSRAEDVEQQLILATLEQFQGDKRKAASALQISLNTLYSRLKEYKAN